MFLTWLSKASSSVAAKTSLHYPGHYRGQDTQNHSDDDAFEFKDLFSLFLRHWQFWMNNDR